MKPQLAVFIGRFQPFHHGHRYVIECALKEAERVLIVLGSLHRARSVKNPFSYEERVAMIRDSLPAEWKNRVLFAGVEDQLYNEAAWVRSIEQAVQQVTTPGESVILIGHDKDHSSYYLGLFPQWQLLNVDCYQAINATPLREAYFAEKWHVIEPVVSQATMNFLKQFVATAEYQRLQSEYRFLMQYKKAWAHTPYPPIFSTVDAVVLCQQHILLIKRKLHPGQGLWALPGGFLEVHERIEAGILRELREETSIACSDTELTAALKQIKVFDYPTRSQVGRVITHAGLLILPSASLPVVQAADDAETAQWHPLNALSSLQDQLHDDHYQIIRWYLAALFKT